MTDEQHTANTDSFATLSEASFAEDWGSKEDRVYGEPEAKLEERFLAGTEEAEFAAVALRLARALRPTWGRTDEEFRKLSQEALAGWDRLLKELGDG